MASLVVFVGKGKKKKDKAKDTASVASASTDGQESVTTAENLTEEELKEKQEREAREKEDAAVAVPEEIWSEWVRDFVSIVPTEDDDVESRPSTADASRATTAKTLESGENEEPAISYPPELLVCDLSFGNTPRIDARAAYEFQNGIGMWSQAGDNSAKESGKNDTLDDILREIQAVAEAPEVPPRLIPEHPLHLAFLGKPHSGKTLQARFLAEKYSLDLITRDGLLGEAVKSLEAAAQDPSASADQETLHPDGSQSRDGTAIGSEQDTGTASSKSGESAVSSVTDGENSLASGATGSNAGSVLSSGDGYEQSTAEDDTASQKQIALLTQLRELGNRVKELLDQEQPITDDLLMELCVNRIERCSARPDYFGGWLLLGLPESEAQARFLEQKLTGFEAPPTKKKSTPTKGKKGKKGIDAGKAGGAAQGGITPCESIPFVDDPHASAFDFVARFDLKDETEPLRRLRAHTRVDLETEAEYDLLANPPPDELIPEDQIALFQKQEEDATTSVAESENACDESQQQSGKNSTESDDCQLKSETSSVKSAGDGASTADDSDASLLGGECDPLFTDETCITDRLQLPSDIEEREKTLREKCEQWDSQALDLQEWFRQFNTLRVVDAAQRISKLKRMLTAFAEDIIDGKRQEKLAQEEAQNQAEEQSQEADQETATAESGSQSEVQSEATSESVVSGDAPNGASDALGAISEAGSESLVGEDKSRDASMADASVVDEEEEPGPPMVLVRELALQLNAKRVQFEEAHMTGLKELLRTMRLCDHQTVVHLKRIETEFRAFLVQSAETEAQRNSASSKLIRAMCKRIASMPPELRQNENAKKQLFTECDELTDRLWKLAMDFKNSAMETLATLLTSNDNALVATCRQLAAQCALLMQNTTTRAGARVNLVREYYQEVFGVTDAFPAAEPIKISAESHSFDKHMTRALLAFVHSNEKKDTGDNGASASSSNLLRAALGATTQNGQRMSYRMSLEGRRSQRISMDAGETVDVPTELFSQAFELCEAHLSHTPSVHEHTNKPRHGSAGSPRRDSQANRNDCRALSQLSHRSAESQSTAGGLEAEQAARVQNERHMREVENALLKAKLLCVFNCGIASLRAVCARVQRLCAISDDWVALRMRGMDEAIETVTYQFQAAIERGSPVSEGVCLSDLNAYLREDSMWTQPKTFDQLGRLHGLADVEPAQWRELTQKLSAQFDGASWADSLDVAECLLQFWRDVVINSKSPRELHDESDGNETEQQPDWPLLLALFEEEKGVCNWRKLLLSLVLTATTSASPPQLSVVQLTALQQAYIWLSNGLSSKIERRVLDSVSLLDGVETSNSLNDVLFDLFADQIANLDENSAPLLNTTDMLRAMCFDDVANSVAEKERAISDVAAVSARKSEAVNVCADPLGF